MIYSKAEIKDMVREAQEKGAITPALLDLTCKILGQINKGFRVFDPEEIPSEAFILLSRVMHKIDPERNSFGFLTTCVLTLLKERAKADRLRRWHLLRYQMEHYGQAEILSQD